MSACVFFLLLSIKLKRENLSFVPGLNLLLGLRQVVSSLKLCITSDNSNKCIGRMAQRTTDPIDGIRGRRKSDTAGIDHNCIRAVIDPDNCISVAGELFPMAAVSA